MAAVASNNSHEKDEPSTDEKLSVEHHTHEHAATHELRHHDEYGIGGVKLRHDAEVEDIELTWRSWVVVLVCCLAIYAQVYVVAAAPTVLAFIIRDLGEEPLSGWVIQAPVLMQAALSPIMGRLSDLADRKWLATLPPLIAVVGAAISATAKSMSVLIAGSVLLGCTLSTISIVQAIPSEILPLKWRVVANGFAFVAGGLGGLIGGLSAGALTNQSVHGWRGIFWCQVGFHAGTFAGLLLFYHPPPVDYPKMPWRQFVWAFDPIGSCLLVVGVTMCLLGFDWTGAHSWSDPHVVSTLVIGWVLLLCFALYEWLGRSDGLVAHVFMRSRNFPLAVTAFAVEGWLFYGPVATYTTQVILYLGFETNSWKISIRQLSYGLVNIASAITITWLSTRYRDVKISLTVTFVCFLIVCIGYGNIVPGSKGDSMQWAWNVIGGVGQSGPLTLLPAVVQYTAPHEHLSTATGLAFCARAIGGALGSSITGVAVNAHLKALPGKVADAAIAAGLPASSAAGLVTALQSGSASAIAAVPGVTPTIIAAATNAMEWAYAHAFRYAWLSIIPFVVVAIVCVLCLQGISDLMTNVVEMTVEKVRPQDREEKV